MSAFDPVAFRRDLHAHPETGFALERTITKVTEVLKQGGLEVTRLGKSGIVASLRRGTDDNAIGFRADMDALPIDELNNFSYASKVAGKFHGCGHDGHTTMLIAAALELSQDSDLARTIHFIFQPDEENGNGANALISDGLFTQFPMQYIYGLHNFPTLDLGHFATQSGAFCAFEDNFIIKLVGTGGHSSMPNLGVDPLVLGSILVSQLQTIVSRNISALDHGVVSVTQFETDGSRNIIPSEVLIKGDCRGFNSTISQTIKERMEDLVKGVCASHGASYEFDYTTSFHPLVNDATSTENAASAAEQVGDINRHHGRVGFSEDFAAFLQHCPGAFILMGNGTEGSNARPLHNPSYDFNDDAIPYGVNYWKTLARQ